MVPVRASASLALDPPGVVGAVAGRAGYADAATVAAVGSAPVTRRMHDRPPSLGQSLQKSLGLLALVAGTGHRMTFRQQPSDSNYRSVIPLLRRASSGPRQDRAPSEARPGSRGVVLAGVRVVKDAPLAGTRRPSCDEGWDDQVTERAGRLPALRCRRGPPATGHGHGGLSRTA